MDGFLFALTLVTALGCGLAGGVLFGFSSFIMKGLARLPPAQGTAAMQAINVAAISFAFMLALFAPVPACVALSVWAIAEWGEPFAAYLLAGSALYLLGVILMTMAFHVPRNNALAQVEPGSPDAAHQWSRYLSEWTAGNHLRSAAGLAAAAAFTVALTVS